MKHFYFFGDLNNGEGFIGALEEIVMKRRGERIRKVSGYNPEDMTRTLFSAWEYHFWGVSKVEGVFHGKDDSKLYYEDGFFIKMVDRCSLKARLIVMFGRKVEPLKSPKKKTPKLKSPNESLVDEAALKKTRRPFFTSSYRLTVIDGPRWQHHTFCKKRELKKFMKATADTFHASDRRIYWSLYKTGPLCLSEREVKRGIF